MCHVSDEKRHHRARTGINERKRENALWQGRRSSDIVPREREFRANRRGDTIHLTSVPIERCRVRWKSIGTHIFRASSHALSVETRSNVAMPEESLESSNKHVELRESSSYRSVLSFFLPFFLLFFLSFFLSVFHRRPAGIV